MAGVRTQWIALFAVAAGIGLGVWWNARTPGVAPSPLPSGPSRSFPSIQPPRGFESCNEARYAQAATRNASSLESLEWAPFRRPERGWGTYAVLIGHEIGTRCPPNTEGFAGALARWQAGLGRPATGQMDLEDFTFMKGVWQERRPFVRLSGDCPAPPDETLLEWNRPGEGYSGKEVQLLPEAFAAYRQMAADARAQVPAIAADPRNLTIFSAYRSPASDDARCAAEGNCNGIVRARCSPHRTGRAVDLYVGQAPGYGPDSSADPNRLYMTTTPTYRWLVANASRYGFVNYPFEPWHWEWTGAAG